MNDLLYFNNVNLDILTKTYNLSFYMSYMTYWPESFLIAKGPSFLFDSGTNRKERNDDKNHHDNLKNINTVSSTIISSLQGPTSSSSSRSNCSNYNIMGYVLGKSEGDGLLWHGHVSAITVNKMYRRIGLAATLMNLFETDICNDQKQNYFVDLFVRTSNTLAIQMYTNFGYRIYRTVIGYYQTSTTPITINTVAVVDTTSNNNNNITNNTNSQQHPTTTTTTTTTSMSTSSTANGGEDAYDMRKSLSRDPKQLSMIPLLHPIYPEDLEW
jgi:N-terminal acetyltransferase B complex catalytic subunit